MVFALVCIFMLPLIFVFIVTLYSASLIKSAIESPQKIKFVIGCLLLLGIVMSEFFTATGGYLGDFFTAATVCGALVGAIVASIWLVRRLKARFKVSGIALGLLFPALLFTTHSIRDGIPQEAVVNCALHVIGHTVEAYHTVHGRYPAINVEDPTNRYPLVFSLTDLWRDLLRDSNITIPDTSTCYDAYPKSWLYQNNTVHYYTESWVYTPPTFSDGWLYSSTDDTYSLGYIFPLFANINRVCHYIPSTDTVICEFKIGDL